MDAETGAVWLERAWVEQPEAVQALALDAARHLGGDVSTPDDWEFVFQQLDGATLPDGDLLVVEQSFTAWHYLRGWLTSELQPA